MMPKILLVEDDQADRERTFRFLSRSGFEVTAVPDGPAALKDFAPGRYDCMVVDYCLPGPNGLDLVREFRKQDDKVSVVMVTGHDPGHVERECEGLRVWSVLGKPFDMEDLADKVRDAVDLTRLSPEREEELAAGFGSEATRMRTLRQDLLKETKILPPGWAEGM
jgi:two-component system response regulator TctD